MFISHLTTVITGLLAVSVPVDGKCYKKPDGNGHVKWPKQKTQILSKVSSPTLSPNHNCRTRCDIPWFLSTAQSQ